MNTARIIERVDNEQFNRITDKYQSNVYVSPHALDHLNNAQRKVFKETDLINILVKENPVFVGLQKNGKYAAFYRRKWGYLRIIFCVAPNRLEIVTFINTENIPHL